jgi:hypothetical protein
VIHPARLALVVLLTALLAAPTAAHAITPSGAIGALNAQRVANGIPGTVVENATWSSSCADHNAYMSANRLLVHDETAGAPGYTATGAWAGPNAVLAFRSGGGFPWAVNPWENAPFHLAQVIQPALRSTGYADNGTYACMTTWPGTDAGNLSGAYTYPGPNRTGVPFAQAAAELPSIPQQSLGIAAGVTTGPNLFVFGYGLGGSQVRITAATLSPSVPVKWVDNFTPGVGGRIPSGAILVPTVPLQANTTYTARVTLQGADRSLDHAWSFTTGSTKLGPEVFVSKLKASFRRSALRTARVSGTGSGRLLLTVQTGRRPVVRKYVRASASGVFSGTIRASATGLSKVCVASGRLKLCSSLRL